MVGHGFLEDFLAVNINGRSGGVVVAWNEMMFAKVTSWMGQFSMTVKLKRHSDNLEMVVVSIYGSKCQEEDRVMGGTRRSGCIFSRVTHADRG